MTYDRAVPEQLKDLQEWFASIIGRPIDQENRMNPLSPSGRAMSQEATQYISPSPSLEPHERIQIYNQQYWWRLLSTLQESFPLLTRLFGYGPFNEMIATPYLTAYPPDHWSLSYLGSYLPQWIQDTYAAKDKSLVYHSSLIDWAYTHSFIAPQGKEIKLTEGQTDLSSLLEEKLILHPHVHLFCLPYDLFEFREEFLNQEPEYWVENDFPKLHHYPENDLGHFVLYRNHHLNVGVEKIDGNMYRLLSKFAAAHTIDDLCQWLEEQPSESPLVVEASKNLHLWIQHWIIHKWLSIASH